MAINSKILKETRERKGLSQQQLADLVETSQQVIDRLERGVTRTTRKLVRLATALDLDVAELDPDFAGVELPPKPVVREAVLANVKAPTRDEMPMNVPIYGTAVGGGNGDGDFAFNGEVIDYARRPAGLTHTKNVFGVYVVGSSMEPKYEDGELVFINPNRRPNIGDYVVVELHGEEGEAGACFVKRLKRRTQSAVIVEQFNPPKDDIAFNLADIKEVHRIVPNNEMHGI